MNLNLNYKLFFSIFMETNHLRDEHLNKPEKKSVGQVVKSFDIFRKLPQDMTSGTQSGALSIFFI